MKVLLCMLLALFYGHVQAQEANTTEAKVKKWLKEKYTAFYASRAKDPAVQQFLLLYDKLDKEGRLCSKGKVLQDLDISAKRTSEETVLVNWEASSNLDVVGYILERSLGKNAPYERVSYFDANPTQVYQYVDNNSSAKKSYYRVVQVMALGKNVEKKAEAEGYDTDLVANAYPNPSGSHFTLSVQSRMNDPLQVRVVDASGRVVEQRSSLPANQLIEIGAQYRPGIFFIQLFQGGKTKQLKLEKRNARE